MTEARDFTRTANQSRHAFKPDGPHIPFATTKAARLASGEDSTMPPPEPKGAKSPPRMASRMRWLMNQADLSVMPRVRWSWLVLTPFLLDAIRKMA